MVWPETVSNTASVHWSFVVPAGKIQDRLLIGQPLRTLTMMPQLLLKKNQKIPDPEEVVPAWLIRLIRLIRLIWQVLATSSS